MTLPRYTSAYGYSSNSVPVSCKVTTRYGTSMASTSTSKTNRVLDRAYRDTPTSGQIVLGFRKPTSWFMLADRISQSPMNYVCRDPSLGSYGRYKFYDGLPLAVSHHGVPSGTSLWNTSAQTVTISSGLTAKSNVKARNKIANSKVNLGVAFGEANRTISMIAKSITTLRRAYSAARRGNFKQVGAVLKEAGYTANPKGAANTWLEYIYGWLPLMSDIYGMQEQLKEGFRKEGYLFKVESTARQAIPVSKFTTWPNGVNHTCTNRSFELSRTVYYAKISDAKLVALNQLGLINPLTIAWELVPFSFVVDWVVPIGSYLESLSATVGTDFVAGFEDRIVSLDCDYRSIYTPYPYVTSLLEGTPATWSRRTYAFERRILASFAPPNLFWGNFLSTTRATSALALLVQLRK